MLQRLHHTITDGEGGIRLSVQFLDFERDPGPAGHGDVTRHAAGSTRRTQHGAQSPGRRTRRPSRATRPAHVRPGSGAGRALRSAAPPPRSPAERPCCPARGPELTRWPGRRCVRCTVGSHRSTAVDANARWTAGWDTDGAVARGRARPLPTSSAAASTTCSSRAAAAAAGRVHADAGMPVDELRVSMPISTRHDRSVGGNAFSPTQTLVPTGEMGADGAFRRDPRDPRRGEERTGGRRAGRRGRRRVAAALGRGGPHRTAPGGFGRLRVLERQGRAVRPVHRRCVHGGELPARARWRALRST